MTRSKWLRAGRDLVLILREYERLLATTQLVDEADVLRLATARLQSSPNCLAAETLVLIPQDLEGQGWRKLFWPLYPGNDNESWRSICLRAPRTHVRQRRSTPTVSSCDGCSNPKRRLRRTVTARCASIGPSAKCMKCVRSYASVWPPAYPGMKWNYCIPIQPRIYVPLAYETWSAIAIGCGRRQRRPVGDVQRKEFLQLFATRQSVYTACLALDSGRFFPGRLGQPRARRLCLRLPDTNEQQPSFRAADGFVTRHSIGLGRDCYLPIKSGTDRTVESQLAAEEGSLDDDDDEPKGSREVLERKLRDLQSLQTLLTRLLAVNSPIPMRHPRRFCEDCQFSFRTGAEHQ